MPEWNCKEHNQDEWNCFKLGEHETHIKKGTKKPSETYSHSVVFGQNLPVVNHISSTRLERCGWAVFDKFKWVKPGHTITYDGCKWVLDGKKIVQFLEELNDKK